MLEGEALLRGWKVKTTPKQHDEGLLREDMAKNPKGWTVQNSSGPSRRKHRKLHDELLRAVVKKTAKYAR